METANNLPLNAPLNQDRPDLGPLFPDDAKSAQIGIPCTHYTCTAGHSWIPKVMTAPCPGCQSPMLGIKLDNCPICNEPPAKVSLRVDIIAAATKVTAACCGQPSLAEIQLVEITRDLAAFEAKQVEHIVPNKA